MPTLKWIHRSKGSTSADIGGSSALSGRSEEAVPDTSTAVFSSASVVPAVSSKQSAEARSDADILVDFQRLIEARPDAGQKRKQKMSPSANAAMAAEKKCKAASERDLPTGVYKALSGKRFVSRIKWGGKQRYIGTSDSPEQASAAYALIRKERGKKRKQTSPWSTEEDTELLRLVKNQDLSHIKWSKIAKDLDGDRLGKRCRERYYNNLDPAIKREPYTAEEDEKICAEVADMGTKWTKIAALLPGRTGSQIKNRWYSTLKRKVASGGFVTATSKSAAANQYATEQASAGFVSVREDLGH